MTNIPDTSAWDAIDPPAENGPPGSTTPKDVTVDAILSRIDRILETDTAGEFRKAVESISENGDPPQVDDLAQLVTPFKEREATHQRIIELLQRMHDAVQPPAAPPLTPAFQADVERDKVRFQTLAELVRLSLDKGDRDSVAIMMAAFNEYEQ